MATDRLLHFLFLFFGARTFLNQGQDLALLLDQLRLKAHNATLILKGGNKRGERKRERKRERERERKRERVKRKRVSET